MANKRYVVGLGEVLWDVLPEGKKLGGAPANFAYHAGLAYLIPPARCRCSSTSRAFPRMTSRKTWLGTTSASMTTSPRLPATAAPFASAH